jgi:hypothetical protein
MKILLGITGSTGVKAIPKLIEKFVMDGHSVQTIVTDAAKRLMEIMIPEKLKDFCDDEDELFEYQCSGRIAHIELARWADIAVIAPCTSNTLNKLNVGICDNLLLSTLKAMESPKPILIAPAMNTVMLEKDIDSFYAKNIAFPTVKKLSCGDFGLGALADIDAIANLAYGRKWHIQDNLWHPGIYNDYHRRNEGLDSVLMTHPGRFGASRKHDIHTGVDLYADETDLRVHAFENGKVVSVGPFTGVNAGCDWWYDSQYVAVEGRSGIIVYGEIDPHPSVKVGNDVYYGSQIGKIVRVLKHPPRKDIPGHSMYMLHVELISRPGDDGDYTAGTWELKQNRPKRILDPTVYLYH